MVKYCKSTVQSAQEAVARIILITDRSDDGSPEVDPDAEAALGRSSVCATTRGVERLYIGLGRARGN